MYVFKVVVSNACEDVIMIISENTDHRDVNFTTYLNICRRTTIFTELCKMFPLTVLTVVKGKLFSVYLL